MTYQQLCKINRALDTFLQPNSFSYIYCLQGIRTLYDYQHFRSSYRLIPPEKELRDRLYNLTVGIYTQNVESALREQTIHELMDTAIHIKIPVHELRQYIREQTAQLTQYDELQNLRNENLLQEYYTNNTTNHDVFNLHNITKDKQNVHHSQINQAIKTKVIKLCKSYPYKNTSWDTIYSILKIRKSWNNVNLKSLQFIRENTATFGIEITLEQLFMSLFYYIKNNDSYAELLDRLNEELKDMSGTCSTGHLSRLLNVLQGYSDEYSINLNPEKEIQNFIYNDLNHKLQNASTQIQEGILDKSKEYLEFVEKQKSVFIKKFGINYSSYIDDIIHKFLNA